MLISPTEPPALRTLGRTSSTPEKHGADYLFLSNSGLVGVQRKEVKDWVASCFDGRLAKEIRQMRSLDLSIVVVEGKMVWSETGTLLSDWGRGYTRAMHLGVVFSMMREGMWLLSTQSLMETGEVLKGLEVWLRKEGHKGLGRPNPDRGEWGTRDNMDWGCWILEGFEGVGKDTAQRIIKHFGRVPLRWDVGEKELTEIVGIGKVKARKLIRALEG